MGCCSGGFFFIELLESMPEWCKAVIEAGGGYMKF
jgi:hypothetical protein